MAEESLSEGDIVRLTIAVSPEYTITGTFTLTDPGGIRGLDNNCSGSGGYEDIKAFLGVTVRAGDGTVLATGRLGRGSSKVSSSKCEFPILVDSVPKSDFYSIEVGHRGELTYSFSEMEAFDWEVALTLGEWQSAENSALPVRNCHGGFARRRSVVSGDGAILREGHWVTLLSSWGGFGPLNMCRSALVGARGVIAREQGDLGGGGWPREVDWCDRNRGPIWWWWRRRCRRRRT